MNIEGDEDFGFRPTPAVEMPCFMAAGPNFIDGWRPNDPVGEYDLDYLTGEIYADMAVQYARKIKDYKVLGLIIATMQSKALRGHIAFGGTEVGFIDRLTRLAYVGSAN